MNTLKRYFHQLIIVLVMLAGCSNSSGPDGETGAQEGTKVYQLAFDSPNGTCDYVLNGVGLCCRIQIDHSVELQGANYYITVKYKNYLYGRDYDVNDRNFGVLGEIRTHIDEDYFQGYIGRDLKGTVQDIGDGYKLFTSGEEWVNGGRHHIVLHAFVPTQFANTNQQDILVYTIYKK